MIIPCIDLMGGKVVQLVQGRERALEIDSADEMLEKFKGFRQIQVIDLDAAMGRGSNDQLVEQIARKTQARVGGGVRTVERAEQLVAQHAHRIIIGTSAFTSAGPNHEFLTQLRESIGSERLNIALDSKDGRIVVKGWKEATNFSAEEVLAELESYCGGFLCTYVDKEGMMEGTDLGWFARLRKSTKHEIVAAGGITTMDDVRALTTLGIHSAIGMAIYTGRLKLDDLIEFEAALGYS
ncbi:MAG: 1-(5-phosphoribosyl)-5-[(5-phosphoribosylamino)methylideneamino] imidazole-4-carboxamide isomerase [Bryobacteraceae bacterium]